LSTGFTEPVLRRNALAKLNLEDLSMLSYTSQGLWQYWPIVQEALQENFFSKKNPARLLQSLVRQELIISRRFTRNHL